MDEVVAGAKTAVVPCVESGIPALVNFSFGVEAVEGGVDGWAGLLAGLHDYIVQPKESITIDARGTSEEVETKARSSCLLATIW